LPSTKPSIKRDSITLRGLRVEVLHKDIKNLHLGVYPPDGRVRVAAPLHVKKDAVRLAVVTRLGWIKRQRAKFEAQVRQSPREMVDGETHYVFGRPYRLRVIASTGRPQVSLRNKTFLELHIPADSTAQSRAKVLDQWYRTELAVVAVALKEKWEFRLGVRAEKCEIRKMRTKWGSCNPQSGRVILNVELAKKPHNCIEYIVLHELAHLVERQHSDRFIALMSKHLPNWRQLKESLNQQPLGVC
jgi:predicted metal-dependent hydrolase